jgi:hypothetical protein
MLMLLMLMLFVCLCTGDWFGVPAEEVAGRQFILFFQRHR